jgi:hypothetical protein
VVFCSTPGSLLQVAHGSGTAPVTPRPNPASAGAHQQDPLSGLECAPLDLNPRHAVLGGIVLSHGLAWAAGPQPR